LVKEKKKLNYNIILSILQVSSLKMLNYNFGSHIFTRYIIDPLMLKSLIFVLIFLGLIFVFFFTKSYFCI
jgi:hypothetical protein